MSRAAALGRTGTVRYAVNTPLCPEPTPPDYYTCAAMRRTTVSKSTRGAIPFVTSATDAGPAGGYTPADLAGAYGYNPNAKVTQTIGVVDWYDDPHALSDLNAFDRHYHFATETSSSFRKVNQAGRTSPLPKPDAGVSGEITLDIQSARAVCRHCRILLVEANSPTDANLAKAENEAVRLGATEISNSYGSAEASHKISDSTVAAYNHPGVVITASTGDEGWYGWDYARSGAKPQNSALFPSTDPTVVSVGGTAIGIQNGKRTAEVVWNEDADSGGNATGATGGGCSRLFYAAPWQKSYPNYSAAGCHGARLAADVSAIADPETGFDVYQTYGGKGWETVGGTSLASPVVAAMWALAGGARGAAYPGSALYVNAQVHPSSVYDVIAYDPTQLATGNSICAGESPSQCYADLNNQNPNSSSTLYDCSLPRDGSAPTASTPTSRECNVAEGLDGPTGLGTPESLRLFTATTPTLSLNGPKPARVNRRGSYRARAKEIVPHTSVTEYELLWGDGGKSTTRTGNVAHTYKHVGNYTVTVLVVDSRSQETVERYRVTVKK